MAMEGSFEFRSCIYVGIFVRWVLPTVAFPYEGSARKVSGLSESPVRWPESQGVNRRLSGPETRN